MIGWLPILAMLPLIAGVWLAGRRQPVTAIALLVGGLVMLVVSAILTNELIVWITLIGPAAAVGLIIGTMRYTS